MRTYATTVALCAVLASCASAPRVSTEGERATANLWLTNIETALTVALAAQKIAPTEFQTAIGQVAELRQLVAESATQPMTWSDVLQRIVNVGVAWAIAREQIESADAAGR